MPRIPIDYYQQRTSAPAPVSQPRMSVPEHFGDQGIAGALDRVGENVLRVQQRDDALEAQRSLSDLRMKSAQLYKDAQGNAELGSDVTPTVVKGFDDLLSSTLENTRTRGAKAFIRQHAPTVREGLFNQSLEFDAQNKIALRKDTLRQSVDKLQAAVQQDPDSWQRAGAEQTAIIDAMSLPPQERLEARNFVYHSLKSAAAIGIAQKDPTGTLTRLADSNDALFGSLNAQTREAVRTHAEGQVVKQQAAGIMKVFAGAGQDAGTRALGALEKSDLPVELQDQIRAHVNAGLSQLREQRRQERVQDLTSVETAIATDTASAQTLNAVQSLYRTGALTPSENAHYTAQIESSIVSRNANQAALQSLTDALNGGLPLDPHDPTHKKILSQAFAAEVGATPAGSPQWSNAAVGLASRTRMLPDQAASWARAAARSPDPKYSAASAQFLGAVQASAPDAMSSFDNETKAFAGTVNRLIEAGTDPKLAVETARTNVFDLKPQVVEQREKTYKEGGKKSLAAGNDSALQSFIGRDFSAGWFHSNPQPMAALSADFGSQTAEYFKKTGDIGLARQLAWSDLKRVYGVSEVNGVKQVMPFPVERFGIKPEEVRKEIEATLVAHPQADGSKPEDIMLVPDALTQRASSDLISGASVQPSYKLVTKSGDLVVDSAGVPLRYTLPGGEELAQRFAAGQAEAHAKSQAVLESARRTRQLLQYFDEAQKDTPSLGGVGVQDAAR
jgi:hypothetical protein